MIVDSLLACDEGAKCFFGVSAILYGGITVFITVSVGGMCVVAATAAATGAITGLYVRSKMAKATGKMREAIATIRVVSNQTFLRPRKLRTWQDQKKARST